MAEGDTAEVATPLALTESPSPTHDVPSPPPLIREPTTKDTARLWLAYAFTSIFAVTILFACIAVLINHNTWGNIKELLPIVMPAETALMGSATGFYFGANK